MLSFFKKELGRANVFIVYGFNKWKKVNNGVNCPLLRTCGKNYNSSHRMVVKCCEDNKNLSRHIQMLFGKQVTKEVENSWEMMKVLSQKTGAILLCY